MCKKICNICNEEKNISEFHKMKKGLFGVRTTCKECRKKVAKEYKSRPEVILKQQKYYQDNKDTFREKMNKHYHSLNGQFHNYKKRAKKGNFIFELTQEDCKKFYKTECEYCGDTIKGLGIDIIDNNLGYILSNCRPCCSTCNYMKHIMNESQFFNQLKKIYNKMNLINYK